MKKFLSVLLITLMLFGCTKEKTDPSPLPSLPVSPLLSETEALEQLKGYWFMKSYEVIYDASGETGYSSDIEIGENGYTTFTFANMNGYILEPNLLFRYSKGDQLKQLGNDAWYMTFTGSMSQAGNEFEAVLKDNELIIHFKENMMDNMKSVLKREIIGTYVKPEGTNSYQAPIYDAMEHLPQAINDELQNVSASSIALIWANTDDYFKQFSKAKYELEDSKESLLIIPVQNMTTMTVYTGEYTGNMKNPCGFDNIEKVYNVTLDAGEPLLLVTSLPEGMPSYFVEFNINDTYVYYSVNYPGMSNPYMLEAE